MPMAVATKAVAMAVAVVTEEVGEFPVALAEAAILVRCLLEAGECSLAAEWALGVASTGVAAIGMAGHGVASAGTATIGAEATGAVAGIITMAMTSFSSAISAFRGGGARILGAGAILTDIMAIPIPMTTMAPDTATHTATEDTGTVTMAMVMGRPAMIMDMATSLGVTTAAITVARTTEVTTRMGVTTAARAMEMTIPPIQEWPSCNADLRGPGITLALLMESWGVRPGKQFALSSATMPNP